MRDRFCLGRGGCRTLMALLVGALVWLVLPGRAHATMTLPMTLREIVQQSGKVFVGRCVAMDFGVDENGLPAAYVTFDVSQSLKGTHAKSIVLKQYGMAPRSRSDRLLPDVGYFESDIVSLKTVTGAGPSYHMDEEVVLFLYPESELGFSSPVGFGQGLFRVIQNGDGRELVTNLFQNMFLGHAPRPQVHVSTHWSSSLKSTPPAMKPIELEELIEWVTQLEALK